MKTLKELLKPRNFLVGAAMVGALFLTDYNKAYAYSDEACRKTVGINGIFQGLIGGVGGVQNGESFWKSFYKSAVGGMLQGAGKCIVAKDLDNAWPAKLTNAAGTSISNNVAQGKGMFDSFGIDLGPAYFEWSKKDGLESYLLAESVASMAYFMSEGYEFDAKKTLKYGTPYFTTDKISPSAYGLPDELGGLTSTNTIVTREGVNDEIVSHELIHTYQYSSSSSLGQIVLNSTGDPSPKWIYIPKAVGLGLVSLSQISFYYEDRLTEREAYRLTE